MTVYRIEKARYAAVAFAGIGALYAAGRWHRRGRPVSYASEHPAVAAMEKLVWLGSYDEAVASEFVSISLTFDASTHLEKLDPEGLPEGWDAFPHRAASQDIGAQWLEESRSVVLEVPSVVVSGAKNYLINPAHPAFASLQVGEAIPFRWDARLFRRESGA